MARLLSARTILFGGLAAGAAYALRNRQAVKGLIGGGQESPAPYQPPAEATPGQPSAPRDEPMPPPPIANVDAPGPPANTATHVPAPDPVVHDPSGGIDEAAEEAAAAAEAANIGGQPEGYPSEQDPTLPADEAFRPLEEAGEGYAEGQELAEADLIDNAEPAAGDPLEGGRAIEDVIEGQDEPHVGERLEGSLGDAPPPSGNPAADVPPPPAEDAPGAAVLTPSGTAMPEESTETVMPASLTDAAENTPADTGPGTTSAQEKSSAVWRTDEEEQPTAEQPAIEDEPRRD